MDDGHPKVVWQFQHPIMLNQLDFVLCLNKNRLPQTNFVYSNIFENLCIHIKGNILTSK